MLSRLDLDGNRVHLGSRMARSIVDPSDRVRTRGFRHTPHHPGIGVAPCSLEVDTLVALGCSEDFQDADVSEFI